MPFGYKILNRQKVEGYCGYTGEWGSFNVFVENRIANQVYRYDEWTKRKDGFGPLALFETRVQAENYICTGFNRHNKRIVECEYTRSVDNALWTINEYGYIDTLKYLPPGTILADKIKVLEILD